MHLPMNRIRNLAFHFYSILFAREMVFVKKHIHDISISLIVFAALCIASAPLADERFSVTDLSMPAGGVQDVARQFYSPRHFLAAIEKQQEPGSPHIKLPLRVDSNPILADAEVLFLPASGSSTLSLDVDEAKMSSRARSSVPRVLLSMKPLDLTKPLTNEALMSAGQLGGLLYPTADISDAKVNHSFGEAIQAWNKHDYKRGVVLFRQHVKDYPDSPWRSEAILHVGCEAQFNGRYSEAAESFKWIIENNKNSNHQGARILTNKAKLRLALTEVYQGDLNDAREIFRDLKEKSPDWRDRTYAAHWLQRLSRYTANELAMANCGPQAIAYVLRKAGKEAEAKEVFSALSNVAGGHNMKTLSDIASRYGFNVAAIKTSISQLKDLPIPAIVHVKSELPGAKSHYWVLDKIKGDGLELFDPQSGQRFKQSLSEFSRQWSGNALVFSTKKNTPGIKLSEDEMKQIFGGCCGTPRAEDNLGSPGRNEGPRGSGNRCPLGSPTWSVNMVNMNLSAKDIPLWYSCPIGPSVEISLTYNSQSAIAHNEPFGNKWQFNYGSYLVVDPGDNVTIFMPDGRRDVYTPDGVGGYVSPYQVYDKLTKIAANHFELKFPDDTLYVYNIPSGTSSLQPFLVEIRDRHGQKLTFGYNADVQLKTITDASGRVTTLTYDTQGLVTQVTEPFGRSASFEYDVNRNLIRITDMGGYESAIGYDSDVYVTSIEDPRGTWEFYIEPADGVVAYSDDYPPPGDHTWQSYRITITNPLGGKEEYFYHGGCGDAVGIRACSYSWYVSPRDYVPYASGSVNNFRSAPKTVYYLSRSLDEGEISKIANPQGGSVSFGYDSTTGNRTSIQDANGNVISLAYDTRGNITRITDPEGDTIQFAYDNEDNLTSLIDPVGNPYLYEYDANNNLTTITDPENGITSFAYNSYSQLTTLRDAKESLTTFAYDTQGYLVAVIHPSSGTDSYTYDGAGRVTSHTDPNGNTTSYAYDGIDRLTEVRYPDLFVKTYAYDCCGPSSITDRNGAIAFAYDSVNRLKNFTDVYGKIISYGYDNNGNLASITYPDGKTVSYEYDKADRLIKITDWLSNVTTYEYDAANNLIKNIYPDGSLITYQYDKANRLKSILDYRITDGTVNAVFNYTLDALGNRTKVRFYQPLNAAPTLGSVSLDYDADNRLLTAGGATYNYDANGNLTSRTMGSNVTTFAWDHNNMLTQIVSGGDTYVYKYDGLGNRIARIENSVETRYIVDPGGALSLVLAETDAGGGITAYYVYGLGLISKITPSGQTYCYHYDGVGSTIAMTDSSGNIVNKYAYDAFGKILNQRETIPNSFEYVGRFGVMDEGNGLLYMRARYYDPEVGRFINKDPIGLIGGLNVYTYVKNNPLIGVDPTGTIYGRYCGYFLRGPGDPCDDLDRVCKEHDDCLTNSGVSFLSPKAGPCHAKACLDLAWKVKPTLKNWPAYIAIRVALCSMAPIF